MNHKIKRKWIAALRSGTYKQCIGWYRIDDKRCAFGVLHEVDPVSRDKGEASAGISLEQAEKIVIMNDSGNTFPEIADWIEENIPDGGSYDRSME